MCEHKSFKGKIIVDVPKKISGRALVMDFPVSFLGDIDSDTGIIKAVDSPKKGVSVKDRIMVMEGSRGSTVGSYVIYALRENNVAPKAMIAVKAEPIIIIGCIISEIPLILVDALFLKYVDDGDLIEILPGGDIHVKKRCTSST